MLHEHGHHHIDENKLSCEHEGHEIHGGDELQSSVAAVVAPWPTRWALSQGVLVGDGTLGVKLLKWKNNEN